MAGKGINRSIRLFINGKEVEHSINNVRKTMNNLRREINEATKGSEEYVRKSAELRKVAAYYKAMNQEITGLPSTLDKLSISTGKFLAIFTAFTSFSFLQQNVRKLIDLSDELVDKQADVRKTTGMTKDEIRSLTQELDKLDTRTSRLDLLSIAEEGGRIGIPKEEIAAFTEAMNKANVALGDTFGSAEAVATTLGKLRFLYKETAEMGVAESYNAIGSALNELGAAGSASEQNIAAFATRVGALPNAFKPTIADAMGLGAAFEESGIDAEVAGRAYSILVQTAAVDTAKFAQVMGITQKEVEDMINSNPTEFFLQFSNSLKGMDSNGVQMGKTLKFLGISADGVNKIIGAASANNERFRQSIALSNAAMEEGTSLTDEYNVKNENLSATIDKIQKRFVSWISSNTVQDFIEGLVEWFGALIGAIDRTDEELNGWQKTLNFLVKVIGSAIAALIAYKTITWVVANVIRGSIKQTLLYQAAVTAKTKTLNWSKSVMISYTLTVKSLTGGMKGLRAAFIMLGNAMKRIPMIAVASAVIGLISYFQIFSKKTNEAADAQKRFGDMMKDANQQAAEGISKTVSQIDSLINIIKDEKISLESRKKAYQELIKIAPEFNGYLKDEIFNIQGLTAVYKNYIKQLHKVAEAKALVAITEQTSSGVISAEMDLYTLEKRLAQEREKLANTERYTGKKSRYFDEITKETVIVEQVTSEYLKQSKVVRDLEKEQRRLQGTRKDALQDQEEAKSFRENKIKEIDAEIELAKRRIEQYKQIDSDLARTFVKNNEQELKYLQQRRSILLGGSGNTDEDSGSTPDISSEKDKKNKEAERRQKVADELIKIEIQKNRQLRDLALQNEKERLQLLDDGWEKEVGLLDVERQERINKLKDELEDLSLTRLEYENRAAEELRKGNKSGAEGFRKQAEEIKKIEAERAKTLIFTEQTYQQKIQTLKLTFLKKQSDDQQKANERELMNLQTRQNNELKAITDLETAKQVLRNNYDYKPEDLEKLKTFESAKSKVILEQQKATTAEQIKQLNEQIDQLQGALNADDAFAGSIWGRIFSDEQREEILQWLEELQNKLSEIEKPKDKEWTDEEKKVASFVDILGFSADQWKAAFENFDKLSGKLHLAQMAVQALSNAWNMYYQAQRQSMQRDLDSFSRSTERKKEALKKQLDEGYISEATYNAKIEKLDADLEKRRAEMEYKSAMSEWQISLLQSITNTAVAITAALKVPPAPNIALAAVAGSFGAIQTALIAKSKPSKPKGYFEGGHVGGSGNYDERGRELADGPLHANEYVIPEWLRRDPQVARIEGFIEARRRGGNPNLHGHDKNDSDGRLGASQKPESAEKETATQLALLSAINRLNDNLEYMQDHPFEAKMTRTMEVAKYISDDLEAFNNHRQKNKR